MTELIKTKLCASYKLKGGGGGGDDGLKIVDGMLVGSGELEGDTYTISGLNVEDGIAII